MYCMNTPTTLGYPSPRNRVSLYTTNNPISGSKPPHPKPKNKGQIGSIFLGDHDGNPPIIKLVKQYNMKKYQPSNPPLITKG